MKDVTLTFKLKVTDEYFEEHFAEMKDPTNLQEMEKEFMTDGIKKIHITLEDK